MKFYNKWFFFSVVYETFSHTQRKLTLAVNRTFIKTALCAIFLSKINPYLNPDLGYLLSWLSTAGCKILLNIDALMLNAKYFKK